MKRFAAVFILVGVAFGSFSQTISNHPLKLTNKPVESVEFVIYSTTNANSSSSGPTQTILGHYDRSLGLPASARIVKDDVHLHPNPNWNTLGTKNMNVLAVDFDGDDFDEVVEVHESTQGITIGIPFISKNPLQTDSVKGNFIITGVTLGVDEPRFRLAKGEFRRDGREYLALAYRDYNTNKIMIHLYTTNLVTHFSTQIGEIAADSFYALGGGQRDEVFDITINDFDGDSIPDIALAALEPGSGEFNCYLRTFKVTPGADTYNGWTITPMGKQTVASAGSSTHFKNLSISSGLYDTTAAPQKQIAVALIYPDPAQNNNMLRKLYVASTGSGANGLNTITVSNSNFSDVEPNFNFFSAVSIVSGDLNNDNNDEIVLAFNGAFRIFSVGDNMTVIPKVTGGAGAVIDEFYQQAKNNAYMSIGDVDMDFENDLLVVLATVSGGTSTQAFIVTVFGVDETLSTLTVKGTDDKLEETSQSGAGAYYHYAAAFGEFKGGRGILKDPTYFTKKVVTPLVVNNGPPYHFDIFDTVVADITGCFPNFNCDMNSQYKEVTTTSSTLQTTLKSDWGVSGTISGGGSVLGIGLKASVTAKYGEEFSNSSSNTSTVSVSTLSTARADDQVYAAVSEFDVYEYPIDSSGVTIGYVLAMIRKGNPIIQWMDSKSADAFDYIPDHEVGNLLSYPSNNDFPTYSGNLATVKAGTGFNVGSGGTLNFSMAFGDFTSSNVSETRTFGLEVNASASYYGVGVEAKGTYNSSEMTSHTSTAQSEVSYTSNLTSTLNPQFSDANYTMTPYVYWAKNGALSLGYSVDPSLPAQGTENFWSSYYVDNPDLTLIMPWRLDPEKGYTLGNTIDKRRLCKSITVNKSSFITGDTVLITAFIHNYSFKEYIGDVDFEFYVGAPETGGTLLSDINGLTRITVSDTFPARGRTPVQFQWKVPAGIAPGPRIYIVIDPDNLITEVHEDNNIGFKALGAETVGIADENQAAPFEAKLFPNPATGGWAQVSLHLPAKGKLHVNVLDLQGRVLKTAYNSELQPGNYLLPISMDDLPAGFHLIQVRHNDKQEVLRMVNVK